MPPISNAEYVRGAAADVDEPIRRIAKFLREKHPGEALRAKEILAAMNVPSRNSADDLRGTPLDPVRAALYTILTVRRNSTRHPPPRVNLHGIESKSIWVAEQADYIDYFTVPSAKGTRAGRV